MNSPKFLMPLVLLGACLAAVSPAAAHRLDEYLQATRLSIETDHLDLEIDLTPGVAMASQVFAWIDTNRDREISEAEGEAYARQMLHSVVLSLDGSSVPITLVESHFPQFSDMRLGIGTIRLRATAKVPAAGAGIHRVSYFNFHRPESSVYLVNALVPANSRIKLADQRRDYSQHRLMLDYTVIADAPPAWSFLLLAGSAVLVLAIRLVLARQESHRPKRYRGLIRSSPQPPRLAGSLIRPMEETHVNRLT